VTEGRSCRDEPGVAGGVSNGSGSHGAPMVQPLVGNRLLTPRFLVLGVFAFLACTCSQFREGSASSAAFSDFLRLCRL